MENFKEDAGKFFSPFLDGFNGEAYSISKVEREKENADLVITFSNGKKLVIENKVKSLPNVDQLNRYSEKFKDASFVLITLVETDYQHLVDTSLSRDALVWYQEKENSPKWNLRTYQTILEFVRYLKSAPCQPYHSQILEDYERFVDQLLIVAENNNPNWLNETFDVQLDRIKLLATLRIADLFLKRKYDLIKWELVKRLEKEANSYKVQKTGYWTKGSVGDVYFESGLTKNRGLMGFKFVVESNTHLSEAVVLGVQIQGTSFRMNAESFSMGSESLYRFAFSLKEKGLWFDFSYVKELTNKPNAKIAGKSRDKDFPEFANFSGSFFYNYIDISGLKLEQVLDCLKKACNQISENLPLIQAELK